MSEWFRTLAVFSSSTSNASLLTESCKNTNNCRKPRFLIFGSKNFTSEHISRRRHFMKGLLWSLSVCFQMLPCRSGSKFTMVAIVPLFPTVLKFQFRAFGGEDIWWRACWDWDLSISCYIPSFNWWKGTIHLFIPKISENTTNTNSNTSWFLMTIACVITRQCTTVRNSGFKLW